MNMNVGQALKTVNIKSTPKDNVKEDKSESFLKSLNKFLEKNKVRDKKEPKEVRQKEETQDEESDDSRGYLNINHLIQTYPLEKTLNTEISLDSMEEIVGQINLGLESELDGQGNNMFPLEGLVMEDEVLENLAEVKTASSLDLDIEPTVDNFNLNLEEVKNNLAKALGKENEVVDLEKATGLEGELLNVKEELDSKIKEVDLKDIGTKPIETKKTEMSNNKENLNPNLIDDIEDIDEESSIVDLIPKADEEIESEEVVKEVDVSKTTLEENKPLETNFLLNRIQNSILASEKIDEVFSTENLQNVEDSIIKFMKVSKDGDTSTMKVKLYPEELGSIDISLRLKDGKIMADILVESEKVRALFLNNSDILNRNLIEQNIPIKNINMSVNDTFNNLENFSGETKDGQAKGNKGQNQDRNTNANKDFNNNPIDSMRIDKINKGNQGLNILV